MLECLVTIESNARAQSAAESTVLIEVWSDIACPWCYIGKRRFAAALDEFPLR